ncbi:zinc finger C2H2-type protein [Fadolivirus algeromassiliense]|jgi:hypothetical protein|uniref:Zinc finger C2H2-type protein n=1 Tax=Fadolivirus FV1/VV64 TaxID=3070911 RepID=A0A7D3V5K2_9VIRU|nr:zinc finger C2H2-type protein [Fadolivirus algeromassiliense]QKF94135.1 zinc finger C2H2-type protein [Fadolivirus FV1/VV64]
MNLHCEICSYTARDNFNYNKHLLTQKHKKKESEYTNSYKQKPIQNHNATLEEPKKVPHKCSFCGNNYATSGSLARHKKICIDKKDLEKDLEKEKNEINNKKDIELLQKELQCKEELIKSLKSEVTNLRMLVNSAGSMVKSSLSTMSYVIKNYTEAPALESIKNMASLHYENTSEEFVEMLISEYRHKTLVNFIGDILIKTYKKDDPSKQSVWNSDTSRLTYVIRELLATNDIDWRVDKKGIKTNKYIIEPIMDYISNSINSFITNFDTNYRFDSTSEAEKKMLKLKHATEINQQINDKVLSEEVLKYIAPHFYLIKTEEMIED